MERRRLATRREELKGERRWSKCSRRLLARVWLAIKRIFLQEVAIEQGLQNYK